jgi:predicted HAD superfamily phosphohydrolase
MIKSNYLNKYLKYKNKYTNLKLDINYELKVNNIDNIDKVDTPNNEESSIMENLPSLDKLSSLSKEELQKILEEFRNQENTSILKNITQK